MIIGMDAREIEEAAHARMKEIEPIYREYILLRQITDAAARSSSRRDSAPSSESTPSVQLVAQIVNDASGDIRTREVRKLAADHNLADDTISWALWKASSLGLIRKIKRGHYASLDPSAPCV